MKEKRILCNSLLLFLVLTALFCAKTAAAEPYPPYSSLAKAEYLGTAGPNIDAWYDGYTLYLAGTGSTTNFAAGSSSTAPWKNKEIHDIRLSYGITRIGSNLTESIVKDSILWLYLPESVTAVASNAFINITEKCQLRYGGDSFGWEDSPYKDDTYLKKAAGNLLCLDRGDIGLDLTSGKASVTNAEQASLIASLNAAVEAGLIRCNSNSYEYDLDKDNGKTIDIRFANNFYREDNFSCDAITLDLNNYDSSPQTYNKVKTALLFNPSIGLNLSSYGYYSLMIFTLDDRTYLDSSRVSATFSPDSYTYTGIQIKPVPIVTMAVGEYDEKLILGTDFTLSYENNINARKSTASNPPSVIIKAAPTSKKVKGSRKVPFTISPKPLKDSMVSVKKNEVVYTGSPHVLEKSDLELKDTDIDTLIPSSNWKIKSNSDDGKLGVKYIQVEGSGNYTGTAKAALTVVRYNLNDGAFDVEDGIWSGSAVTPKLTMSRYNPSLVLTEGTDYTAEWKDNTEVGTATVTVTGIGNYTGSRSRTFQIRPKSISGVIIDVISSVNHIPGQPHTPKVTVYDGAIELTAGTDYSVSYSDNLNAGTAKVTVTGKGHYTGDAIASFTILPISLSAAGVTADEQAWTGKEIKPSVKVNFGDYKLVQGTDYTVSYSDNINEGTAKITITGTGNYTGTASGFFLITKSTKPAESTKPAGVTTAAGRPEGDITPGKPAKLTTVHKSITDVKDDTKDVKGATFTLLQARAVPKSNTSVKLSWNKVPGTSKYIIYGNRCGKNRKYEKLKTVKKSKSSVTWKGLKKGTYYKYIVVAVKGKNVLATSKTVHVATNGGTGKKGNAVSVTLSRSSLTLKAGKSKTVKASVKAGKLAISTHRKVAWESDNINVAKVNSKGKITAVGKGTCYVYAYAQNGVFAKVMITVK